ALAAFPYGGLHGTLLHILDAEWGWRMFLQNDNWSYAELNIADFPTLAALNKFWEQEEQRMRTYLATLSDADMEVHRYYTIEETGEKRDRILWHCLLHVVNYGTQHRSEAAALLTEYNCSPGDLDFTVFLSESQK